MGAREEIERLIYEYASRLDAGDLHGVGALFAQGEIVSGDNVARGAEEVEALYRQWVRIYPDGTPRTKHLTANVVVEVDEARGTASARSVFVVFQQTDSLPLQPIIAGRYEDEFARRGDEWCFRRRRIISELFGDLSQHLLNPFQG
ncbi:MAG: nuclear transport factor 2 family protein [Dehalococcoidia bacterium]|jgi:3-phenylpropionate/cinnamic acid dioxygenase small subunit|nr:nuclear transport factor 2 family protein [Dehalococcoidia bacterium]MDW8009604.1 nuclear transport factor 2 family protein [Chloroflexota bacterium]